MVKFVFGTGRLSSKDFLVKYSRNRNLGNTINGLQVELMAEAKGLLFVNGNHDGIR